MFVTALCCRPICLFVTGPIVSTSRSHHLSDSDWLLLETLDTRCQRPLHTGRFLTMHKRRRKRLTTRSLTQEPGLLDDIHHGQVQVHMWLMNNPTNSLVEEPEGSTKAHPPLDMILTQPVPSLSHLDDLFCLDQYIFLARHFLSFEWLQYKRFPCQVHFLSFLSSSAHLWCIL